MSKCKCGRELNAHEKCCPSCSSKKSRGWKLAGEIILLILGTAVGGGAIYKKYKK